MTKIYSGISGFVKFAGWLFFSFDGRVGQKTFIIASAVACIPLVSFAFALQMIGQVPLTAVFVSFFFILFFCTWWNLALTKKRCNDLDVSLWILYSPFISSMRLYFDEGDAGENSYGVRPKFTWRRGPWV